MIHPIDGTTNFFNVITYPVDGTQNFADVMTDYVDGTEYFFSVMTFPIDGTDHCVNGMSCSVDGAAHFVHEMTRPVKEIFHPIGRTGQFDYGTGDPVGGKRRRKDRDNGNSKSRRQARTGTKGEIERAFQLFFEAVVGAAVKEISETRVCEEGLYIHTVSGNAMAMATSQSAKKMNIVTTAFLSIILMLTSCSGNGSQPKIEDRLLEDPEHYIKDSPNITKFDSTILYTGWYYIVDSNNSYRRGLEKSTDSFFIDPKPIVVAKNFTTLEIYESNAGGRKYAGLILRLDEVGTENWSVATERAIGKQLAFILDNRLLNVAKVNSQISNGLTAINRGDYSRAELENFKTIIESEK